MYPPPPPPEPRPVARRDMSRRYFLLGMGLVAGTATAGVACGGVTTLMLSLRGRARRTTSLPSTATPQPVVQPVASPTPTIAAPDPLPVIPREDWDAIPVDHDAIYERGFYDSQSNPEGWYTYDEPLQESYQTVVIHHSAFYEDDDLRTLAEVQSMHRGRRGWADVGYHLMIGRAGDIYEGRTLEARGAHVAGYNTGSVGVCLLGNFEVQTVTPAQYRTAQRVVNWLATTLQLTHLAGHRDFQPITACPGEDLYRRLSGLAANAGLSTGADGYIPPADATATPLVDSRLGACACGCCDRTI